MTRPHPATFREDHLKVIRDMLDRSGVETILDPFAGVGTIHKLRDYGFETYGIEKEPEWAEQSLYNVVGDSSDLIGVLVKEGMLPGMFDATITSPSFGNRMADHHEAKDSSVRNTYRHKLGRPIEGNSSAIMQWGDEYRAFHRDVWRQVDQVTRYAFILNTKNHIRKGEVAEVNEFHVSVWEEMGWWITDRVKIPTKGNGFGANGDARVDHEMMYMFARS